MVLPMDERLFGAAVNTHNVYLEVLFSGGVVLFALFIAAAGISILRCMTRRHIEALIILLFFLVRGVAETAPFGGLPLFATLVFYIGVAMSLAPDPARQAAGRRGWAPHMRLRPRTALSR